MPKLLIMGGSLGGLSAAVALNNVGCEVDVLERSSGELEGRGAGIVVQPDLLQLTAAIDGHSLPMTTCSHRRYLDARGRVTQHLPMAQQFTSWDAIFSTLRHGVDDQSYHANCAVKSVENGPDSVSLRTQGGHTFDAGGVVFADGARSKARDWLGISYTNNYAGYIAWRGVVDEAETETALIESFDDRFTFGETSSGGHILCYFIPGKGNATNKGQRRLNWVWYQAIAKAPVLESLLTDKHGAKRTASVAPGELSADSRTGLMVDAERELPTPFIELVNATAEPFIQAISDLSVDQMSVGRACLLGDAAFVVRPHTAGATAKAAADAMTLASQLKHQPGDLPRALRSYAQQRLHAGHQMSGHGVNLGRRSVTT